MGIIHVTNTVALSERIITSFCLVHNIVLFLHTIWSNTKNKKREMGVGLDLAKPLYYVTNMTLLSYLSFGISCVLTTFIEYFASSTFNIHCFYWYSLMFLTYYIAKLFIWEYSIVRLKIAFKNAPSLQYNKTFLFILSFVFVIIITFLITFCLLTMGEFEKEIENPIYCTFNAKIWFYVVLGITDSSISILCYWLFYRKLKMLMSSVNISETMNIEENKHEICKDYALLYILRKYAILSAALIISTCIAASFSMFTESGLGAYSIDSVINCWCIILFDARYDTLYLNIFGCIAKKEWNKRGTIIISNNTSENLSKPTGSTAATTEETITSRSVNPSSNRSSKKMQIHLEAVPVHSHSIISMVESKKNKKHKQYSKSLENLMEKHDKKQIDFYQEVGSSKILNITAFSEPIPTIKHNQYHRV